MNWKRVIGYGVLVWLVPFAVSFIIFGIHESNRALFESVVTVVAVVTEVILALTYFRGAGQSGLSAGLAVGVAWMVVSIVIDLPIFLAVFKMPLVDYIADIAVSYLAMPAITAGIAVARGQGGQS